jgi:uncharacterized protein YqjF (DUF2071 family)
VPLIFQQTGQVLCDIPFMPAPLIDRIAPTLRPNGRCRGYQEWRQLLFMHWPIAAETLRPLVPGALDLDLYEGTAYVGIVPFAMQGVRSRRTPKRLAFRFLETNVRTYVCHKGRPGVYFFSLEAASRLAVWAARKFWGLPYFHAEMSITQHGDEFLYQSKRLAGGVIHRVRYRLGEWLGPSKADTIEHFFLERYLLFTEHRGRLYAGQVHHTPYPAQVAEILELEDHLMEAAGLGPCPGPPAFAHFAAGVDVEVFDLKILP